MSEVLEVIAEFPFQAGVHRAAWAAAMLTPLARFAFDGPAPLFLVDANVRGVGKGLLLHCLSTILTGDSFSVATYTNDKEELNKLITSLAIAGDRMVLFDNLEGKFGNGSLDAALTGRTWRARVLGFNRMVEVPLFMTWYATGNNVALAGDTGRRVCHIRLKSDVERPEERQGFRHPDLLAWAREHRGRILRAALTVLRAYHVAGRPVQRLLPWGSFEAWSDLVRSAVVWAGEFDPGETRQTLRELTDADTNSLMVLMDVMEKLGGKEVGLTAAEILDALDTKPSCLTQKEHAEFRDAIVA